VPPHQCPDCGRFLKADLVDGLSDGPAACPRCGTELTAAMFAATGVSARPSDAPPPEESAVHEALTDDDAATSDDVEAIELAPSEGDVPQPLAAAAATVSGATSVRPPDLAPDSVRRRDELDVLAGWDADADVVDVAAWGQDRRPFPTDTVVVLGAGVAGAVGGTLLDRRRGRGAALGGLAGLVAAGVVRRIWRLDT